MRAIVVDPSTPLGIGFAEVSSPAPVPGQAVIEVWASGEPAVFEPYSTVVLPARSTRS